MITLFGVLWILLFFFIVYKKKLQELVLWLLAGMLFQCNNVFVIGIEGIGPQIVSSIAFFIISLFPLKQKITVKLSMSIFLAFIMLILVIYSIIVNNCMFDSTMLYVIMLAFYIVCATRLMKLSKEFTITQIDRMLHQIIWFLVIIGIIQFLASTYTIPKFDFLKLLFWNDSNNNNIYFYMAEPCYRIYSLFMEPSYFAPFVVGSFYYLCFTYKKTCEHYILMGILLVETILTQSSTAYGCLLICGLIYLFITKNYRALKILIPAGLITIIVTFKFTNLFSDVVLNKMSSGSGQTRMGWNMQAWKNFLLSPVYGTGYMNSRASSLILTILGEMGILGLISYLLFVGSIIVDIIKKNVKSGADMRYICGILMFLTATVCAQIIAVPDLHYCGLWFSIYLASLIVNCKVIYQLEK